MKKLKEALARNAWDVILILGAVSITIGAAQCFAPAGFIVGGFLAITGAVLANRGGGDGA